MMVAFFEVILILLIVALLSGGIAMLVIGLLRKRKGLWIGGTVMLSLTFVLGILGFLMFLGFSRSMDHTGPYYDSAYEVPETQPVSGERHVYTPLTDSIMRISFDRPLQLWIQDSAGGEYPIDLFAHHTMQQRGISLNGLRIIRSTNTDSELSLLLDFSKVFSGKLMIEAYDRQEKSLANLDIDATAKANSSLELTFSIPGYYSYQQMAWITVTAFE